MAGKYSRFAKLAENLGAGAGKVGSAAMDYLARPNDATRAAVYEMQKGEGLSGAGKAAYDQLFNSEAPEAPTGIDIADKFSEDYGVTNPYALGALATLADIADPTMLVPGGQATKGVKALQMASKGSKGAKTAQGIAKAVKLADEAPAASKGGRMVQQGYGLGKTEMVDTNTAKLVDTRDQIMSKLKSDPKAFRTEQALEMRQKNPQLDELITQFEQGKTAPVVVGSPKFVPDDPVRDAIDEDIYRLIDEAKAKAGKQ